MEFKDVAGDALQETRAKLLVFLTDPAAHWDAINLALGLFSGIVLRRLTGIADPEATITCPRCGKTSYHPQDIAEKYCGYCHQFHAEMTE
jgi:hypothetical protein